MSMNSFLDVYDTSITHLIACVGTYFCMYVHKMDTFRIKIPDGVIE
jgi:hypothetical protein